MSKLIACPVCGNGVSASADSCPKCKEPNPGSWRPSFLTRVIIVGLGLLFVYVLTGDQLLEAFGQIENLLSAISR